MDRVLIVQGLIVLVTVGIILYILYLCLHFWHQKLFLSQQLQLQQDLMEKTFASIHNGPVQMLGFLIREVEVQPVNQQELLEYLRGIYQDILVNVEQLNMPHSTLNR
ncbi:MULTISPECIES: hypothetical protein [Nostocales]|uniref:Histidine kinase n=3 Tax=Nostocales TaxID=1161 RepID=A0A0C1RBD7_9CYAN|nr:hypothetical protein [Tolypothrix bouteillei]KAF3888130.1 hypothetical protein DA73_0400023520 [Tolypothrix bouteillei VB521301]